MNIMSKLAFRQLRANKKRTVVTVLGVIISVAMITAVSTFSGSFLDLFQRVAIAQDGDWHARFGGTPAGSISTITENKAIGSYGIEQMLGFAQLPNKTGSKVYMLVDAQTEGAFTANQVKLVEGRLPTSPTELVVSTAMLKAGAASYQVGQTITLPVGRRMSTQSEGEEVQFNSPYTEGTETLVPEKTRTYTIVGIADMGVSENSYRPFYTALTYLDISKLPADSLVDIQVKMAKPDKGIYATCEALQKEAGSDPQQLQFNSELLFYGGISSDTSFLNVFISMAFILIIVIMVGSVALIYNAFAISISERSRQFGMLASIGATGKQKRNAVFTEAGFIGLIAIPFGILFGLLGIGITFKLLSPLIMQSMGVGVPLRLVVMPSAIVAAIFFSLLTIFISAWVPAHRAASISPIDAIRQTKDVTLKRRSVKTSKLTRRIFGVEGEVALKNLKRDRKRYRVTLFSLIISLVLYLTASAFSLSFKSIFLTAYDQVEFDLSATVFTTDEKAEVPYDSYYAFGKEALSQDGVTEGDFLIQSRMLLKGPLHFSQQLKELTAGEDQPYLAVVLTALDDKSLEAYAKEVGADLAALHNSSDPTGIFINQTTLQQGHVYEDFAFLDIEDGDVIPLTIPTENGESGIDRNIKLTTAKKVPLGLAEKAKSYHTSYLIVSNETFEALAEGTSETPTGTAFLKAKNSASLEETLTKLYSKGQYKGLYGGVNNYASMKQRSVSMTTIVDVFIYGFVTLIALISVANIFNTISTSLALRKREFAMLKSVGMTPRSFNRMIRFESLFYGIKTILYGLPLGLLVMYGIYFVMRNNFRSAFVVPWLNVIFGIVAIFAIIAMTMFYASRKIKKDSIIETLRTESI